MMPPFPVVPMLREKINEHRHRLKLPDAPPILVSGEALACQVIGGRCGPAAPAVGVNFSAGMGRVEVVPDGTAFARTFAGQLPVPRRESIGGHSSRGN